MTNLLKIENSATKKIKSFQYLDTDKMYSISSQIFEGLTDYVLSSKQKSTEESNTQKGREWGSGRILADIIEESATTTEKRFLHDYSYNLFEDALVRAQRVIELDETNIAENITNINDKSFVRITGKALFNDTNRVVKSLTNFNEFGYAVWYMTQGKDLVKAYKENKASANKIVDRNKKAATLSHIDGIVNFKELIEEAGLYIDPEHLHNMAYLLDYGYEGQFEIQLPLYLEDSAYLFSAQLKRGMLKEEEALLIRKFSRETEKEFTVFGILTQSRGVSEKLDSYRKTDSDQTLKQALMNFVSTLTKLEDTFTGKLEHEYVIDPIAVYIEL